MRKILIGCDHKRLLGEGEKPRATGLATGGGRRTMRCLACRFIAEKEIIVGFTCCVPDRDSLECFH